MSSEPDLRFDIPALFAHLVDNLDQDLQLEMEWVFGFHAPDIGPLESLADSLGDEFEMQLQPVDEAEETDGDEQPTASLFLSVCGVLTCEEVETLAKRMNKLAHDAGVTYAGVDCFDAEDDESLFGWLDLEGATWRLRHYSDSGLETDEDLPWLFLVRSATLVNLETIATSIEERELGKTKIDDEVDEDGLYSLLIFVSGSNNEAKLSEMFNDVQSLATANEAELDGVQFFSEDDLEDVFLDDE